MKLTSHSRFLFVAFLLPILAFAGEPKDSHYDEVRRADGSPRLHYEGITDIYSRISPTRQRQLLKESEKLFAGDNPLNLLPRVLTESEMENLRAGVQQRADALKLFFEDHYSGRKTYLKNRLLPREFVDQIISRHGEQPWEGRIPNEALNWLYGPDILRLPNGAFAVVEDNFGYIGGLGDLVKAPEVLLKLVPEYQRYLDIPNPIAFYQRLANRYHERARKFGGKTVLLQFRPDEFDDNEGYRLRELMERFGIEYVEFSSTKTADGRNSKFLEVTPDGVYLRKRVNGKLKSEKVGYVFIHGHLTDIDSISPYARRVRLISVAERYLAEKGAKADARLVRMMKDNALGKPFLMEEAESLLSQIIGKDYADPSFKYGQGGVPGLFEAMMSGKVGANYAPGLKFAEDKEFYTAVPKLIRHYLKQEPILENIETGSFRKFSRGEAVFDADAFAHVFDHLEDYVVKGVAGMGGAEVWIGPKMARAEIEKLKDLVRESPSLFIYQKFLPLSVMDGNLVDLRLIADVGPKAGDVVTAPFPWGRASPLAGSGKVNISSGGSETAVFVRRTETLDCKRLLH